MAFSGDYISVTSLESQRYIILKAANMRRVDAGHALDLVWAEGGSTLGGADRYAVVQSHANYKVRLHILGNARIKTVGKSNPCMVPDRRHDEAGVQPQRRLHFRDLA